MHTMAKCIIVMCAFSLVAAASHARTEVVEGLEVTKIEVGDVAPEFKLFGVDMRYHTLSQYQDKDVIAVVFTTNHCPVSIWNIDPLVELHEQYHEDHNVQFLLINPNPVDEVADDGFEEMIERAAGDVAQPFRFPYLYDETQQIAYEYGVRRTDTVFLLGPADDEGQRRVEYIGPVDEEARNVYPVDEVEDPFHMTEALDALLAGEEIERPEVEAFGCTVKYRQENARIQRFGYDPFAN